MLRSLLLTLVAFSSCCQSVAVAQVKLSPEYAAGQPVVVEVVFPDQPEGAEADVRWTVGGDAGYQLIAPTKIHVWPVYSTQDTFLPIRANGYLFKKNAAGEKVVIDGSHLEFVATSKILAVGRGPDPKPDDPPTPEPKPDGTAPIPEAGFRVLVVYETKDLSKMPAGQQSILFDKDVRDYLTSTCLKGQSGVAEWRMIDPNVAVAPDSSIWAKALARERKSLPWLLISDGKRGFEGPLPENKAAFLELVKKYAEAK